MRPLGPDLARDPSVVIGLDMSLTSTGVAAVAAGTLRVTLHRIRSKGAKDDTFAARGHRLEQIAEDVQAAAQARAGTLVVIESPAYSRLTGHMHDRSGLWWLTVALMRDLGCDVVEVTPNARAKYGAGKGNAAKDEVLAAMVRRFPDLAVDGNDVADALILASMGIRWLGSPLEDAPGRVSPSKACLTAMDAVVWPEPLWSPAA